MNRAEAMRWLHLPVYTHLVDRICEFLVQRVREEFMAREKEGGENPYLRNVEIGSPGGHKMVVSARRYSLLGHPLLDIAVSWSKVSLTFTRAERAEYAAVWIFGPEGERELKVWDQRWVVQEPELQYIAEVFLLEVHGVLTEWLKAIAGPIPDLEKYLEAHAEKLKHLEDGGQVAEAVRDHLESWERRLS